MPDGAETYYLLIDGKRQGPFSVGQVQGLLHDGVIDEESLVCQPGMAQWEPLKAILPQVAQNSTGQALQSQAPNTLSEQASSLRPLRTHAALVIACAIFGIFGVGGLIWGFLQRNRASTPTVQPASTQAQTKQDNESRQPTNEQKVVQKIDAQELLKKAELGEADAQAALGSKYSRGEEVPRDYNEALKWLRKAAEQGNARGQNSLGLMHELGRGVPENPVEAFEWFSKSAAQGFGLAIDNLRLLEKKGFTKEYVEALKTKPDPSSPQGVLKAFLNCSRWEDRLVFTRPAPGLRDAMAGFYAKRDGSWPVIYDPTSLSVESLVRPGVSNAFRINVKLGDRFDSSRLRTYYVTKVGSEYKVDWLASQGVNNFKLLVFKSTRPNGPYIFRLFSKISDYYNYDYRDKQSSHFSISLHESGSFQDVHGYVRKDTRTGQDLFKLLADGEEHEVVLELSYPVGSSETSITTINRIIALDWFVP